MAEDIKCKKYMEEASGQNDPIAAFLAIKSIVETNNKRTNLRKLGNVLSQREGTTWPYKDLLQHLRNIYELDGAFCCGGTFTLHDIDLNLHLQVRDKRFISDLSNATAEAHRLNDSRPWHDAGRITNLSLPLLKEHSEARPPNSPSTENKNFRLKHILQGFFLPPFRAENCPICRSKAIGQKIDQNDMPMFFHTMKKEIVKKLSNGLDVVLVPHKINMYAKDGRIGKIRDTSCDNQPFDMGFVVVVLPMAYKGGTFRVHNGKTKEEFQFSSRSSERATIQWVAFKSHCHFEMSPVTEGTCMLLTFRIFKIPIDVDESKICPTCKPVSPRDVTTFKTGDSRKEQDQAVKKFSEELKSKISMLKEKKIGVFLKNRYTINDLELDNLKGIDELIAEELGEMDIILTPILLYFGGVSVTNHLLEVQVDMWEDKCVYAFSPQDFDTLLAKQQNPQERPQEQDVAFIGADGDADLILQRAETEPVGLPFMQHAGKIRWSFRCAMIISQRKRTYNSSGKKKSKGGNKRRTREKTQRSNKEKMHKRQEEEEGATALSDTESDVTSDEKESLDECRACGKTADDIGRPLRTCAQCHEAQYCSRKCQKNDWRQEHKYTCEARVLDLD